MIYITGDIHGNLDINKLNANNFTQAKKGDYVIICGDFGLVFTAKKYNRKKTYKQMEYSDMYESSYEKWWLKWLSEKPWTTLFVDGNHENHQRLHDMKVHEWNGGKVHMIRPNIIHLMRGQVYDIDNSKIFCMGGASSHDKEYRIKNVSWWEEELPSDEEYEEAVRNLSENDNKVDYIITHCLPDSVQDNLGIWMKHDKLTNFLQKCVLEEVEFKNWYCGHYHVDVAYKRFNILYRNIVKAGETKGGCIFRQMKYL